MIMESLLTDKDVILPKGEEFAKLILGKSFDQLIAFSMLNQKKEYSLNSDNVENIETGISGILLYLLEIFEITKEKKYLNKIEEISQDLICYCKKKPTNNYSLYTGRGGFIYFLIQLYNVNHDENLIIECEEMIRPAGEDFLESDYTSDYLYNGRSGFLVVLIELYSLNHSVQAFKEIVKFTKKIIQNAILTNEGISWKAKEELNLKNSCGFTFGASGIRYVLNNLKSVFFSEMLNYIIGNIDKFVDSNWDEQNENWLNFEKDIFTQDSLCQFLKLNEEDNDHLFLPINELNWSKGKAGILISDKSNGVNLDRNKLLLPNFPKNIYDGLAGIGLCLLGGYNSDEIEEYLPQIIVSLLSEEIETTLEGGLIFGNLGVFYFLIKTLSPDYNKRSNIVIPSNGISDRFKEKDRVLGIGFSEIKEHLISRYYSRTIRLLKEVNQNGINEYWDNKNFEKNESEILKFENFLFELLVRYKNEPVNEMLEDVFNLEKKKRNFNSNATNLQLYLSQLKNKKAVIDFFNLPDDCILNQKLKISDSIKNVCTKWDWSVSKNNTFANNLKNTPGEYEYLLLMSYENRVDEYLLTIEKFVFHCFESPKTISEAIEETKNYFNKETKNFFNYQSRKKRKELSRLTNSKDFKDFKNRIDYLMLNRIKRLMFDGALILNLD